MGIRREPAQFRYFQLETQSYHQDKLFIYQIYVLRGISLIINESFPIEHVEKAIWNQTKFN